MAKQPIYRYSDQTEVTFVRSLGGDLTAVLIPGETLKDGNTTIYRKGLKYYGPTSNDDYDYQLDYVFSPYVSLREKLKLSPSTFIKVSNPPTDDNPFSSTSNNLSNNEGQIEPPPGFENIPAVEAVGQRLTAPQPNPESQSKLPLKRVLSLLNIDLDQILKEQKEKAKTEVLETLDDKTLDTFQNIESGAGGSGVINQIGNLPSIATGDSTLNTSSLDLFQDNSGSFASPFPTSIEFLTISGSITDTSSGKPIPGAKVRNIFLKKTTTDKKGQFVIQHPVVPKILTELDILSLQDLSLIIVPKDLKEDEIGSDGKKTGKVITTKYSPTTYVPYTANGELKSSVGLIGVKRLNLDLSKEIADYLKFPDNIVQEYNESYATYDYSIQKETNKIIVKLKGIIIPLLLTLIAIYGISEVKKLIQDLKDNKNDAEKRLKEIITCPPKKELDIIIAKKNKLVNGINQTYKGIEQVVNGLEIADTILDGINISYQLLKFTPTPTAVLGVGIPIFVVNLVQDAKQFLANNLGKIRHINKTTLNILRLLETVLGEVLDLLKILDITTQLCYPNEDIKSDINEELRALSNQESNNQSPIVVNVNGFTMGIEIEKSSNSLKRKRAKATNKQGVIMLRGEYSFSSIDQILIDELVFYIQQNNLKAD